MQAFAFALLFVFAVFLPFALYLAGAVPKLLFAFGVAVMVVAGPAGQGRGTQNKGQDKGSKNAMHGTSQGLISLQA